MVDVSRVQLSGPLASHLEAFAGWLALQGRRPPSMVLFHARRMAHVSRWMEAQKIVADLPVDSSVAEAFLGPSLPSTSFPLTRMSGQTTTHALGALAATRRLESTG